MTAPIEEAELAMLAYLAEQAAHAGRHHQRLWMDPKPLIRALGLTQEQFATDAGRLVELGLAGVRKFADDTAPAPEPRYCAIWLTGKGEDYMQALETALGTEVKLTAEAVQRLWARGSGAIVGTARQLQALLPEHARHRLTESHLRVAAPTAFPVG